MLGRAGRPGACPERGRWQRWREQLCRQRPTQIDNLSSQRKERKGRKGLQVDSLCVLFHRAENLSYMPCERLAMRETEVDRQWYPVVIVTKPDDRRIRCPSTSRPIVPSNAPWRRCCTRVATVTRSSTSTRWPC